MFEKARNNKNKKRRHTPYFLLVLNLVKSKRLSRVSQCFFLIASQIDEISMAMWEKSGGYA